MSHAAILSDEMYDSPQAPTLRSGHAGFLYEKESSHIRDAYFEVYKKYRRAFGRAKRQASKEAEVLQALTERLMSDGFRITPPPTLRSGQAARGNDLLHSGFVVDEKIFIHVAVKPHLAPADEERFGRTLTASGCRLGFLINFGSDRLQVARRIA